MFSFWNSLWMRKIGLACTCKRLSAQADSCVHIARISLGPKPTLGLRIQHHWGTGAQVVRGTKCGVYKTNSWGYWWVLDHVFKLESYLQGGPTIKVTNKYLNTCPIISNRYKPTSKSCIGSNQVVNVDKGMQHFNYLACVRKENKARHHTTKKTILNEMLLPCAKTRAPILVKNLLNLYLKKKKKVTV